MERELAEKLIGLLMEKDCVDFILKPSAFTRLCGTNKSASDVLARLYYWMKPTVVRTNGKEIVTYKYGKFSNGEEPCLVKSLDELALETQIGESYSMSRVLNFLEAEGYIRTKVKRINKRPMMHIVMNWEHLYLRFLEAQNQINAERGLPEVVMEAPKKRMKILKGDKHGKETSLDERSGD